MGTSDYTDLAEQPLAPFKHGTDVLISATTNRPVKEAGIKPHVYWCEICKIKLTHAMSAIAHFAGAFHLKKAGFLKDTDVQQQVLTPEMERGNPDLSMQYPEAPFMNNASLAPPSKKPSMDGGGFTGFVGGGNLSMNNTNGSQPASATLPASSSNASNYYWNVTSSATDIGNGGNSLSNSLSNSSNYTSQRAPWESGNPASMNYSNQVPITDYRSQNPRLDNTGQSSTYRNVPEDGVKSYSYQSEPLPRDQANPYSVLGVYSKGNETDAQYTNVASRYGAPPPKPSQHGAYPSAPGSNITGPEIASALDTLENAILKDGIQKPVYCHNFNKYGHCPYGVMCTFKHEKAPVCPYDQKCTRQNCGFFHNPKPGDQTDVQQKGNTDDGKAKARAERVAQLETIIQQMSGSNIDPSIIAKLNTELAGLKNSL